MTRRFFYPQPVFKDGELFRVDLIDEENLEIIGSLAGVLKDEAAFDDGYLTTKLRSLSAARPGLADSIETHLAEQGDE